MKRICILGEGAWGTAVATVLAHNGHAVNLWCHFKESVQNIQKNRINERYLPGVVLDSRITPTHDLAMALADAQYVFEAIPVKYLRAVLEKARPFYQNSQQWVALSKGIEKQTLLVPAQIAATVLDTSMKVVVLSGPSFAYEVARKKITGVVLACQQVERVRAVEELISNEYLTTVETSDVIGVQLCGALKNVLALGVGIIEGMGQGDNARALFFTRAFDELTQLVLKAGGTQETVYDLAGLGDCILTALGSHSKNLTVGRKLGAGEQLDTILESTGYIPEGIDTAYSVPQLLEKYTLQLPLLSSLHAIFYQKKSPEILLEIVRK